MKLSKSKIIGLIALLAVVGVVCGTLVWRQSQLAPAEPTEQVSITGYLGGEKIGLFDDAKFKALAAKQGIAIDYRKAGSLAMMDADRKGMDYLFPSSRAAVEYGNAKGVKAPPKRHRLQLTDCAIHAQGRGGRARERRTCDQGQFGRVSHVLDLAVNQTDAFKQIKDDVVIVYPTPTVWSTHTLMALDEKRRHTAEPVENTGGAEAGVGAPRLPRGQLRRHRFDQPIRRGRHARPDPGRIRTAQQRRHATPHHHPPIRASQTRGRHLHVRHDVHAERPAIPRAENDRTGRQEGARRLHANQLPALEAEAAASGDAMQAQVLKDFKSKLDRFAKRLDDLDRISVVTLQTAPQIKIIQNADQTIVDKIDTTISTTIPVWKSQMVIALGLSNQRKVLDLQNKADDVTNKLLARNAAALHKGAVDAEKANQRSVVEIDTLEKINAELIATLKETVQIQKEGEANREAAQVKMRQIESDLKNALLENAQQM